MMHGSMNINTIICTNIGILAVSYVYACKCLCYYVFMISNIFCRYQSVSSHLNCPIYITSVYLVQAILMFQRNKMLPSALVGP